MSTPRPIIFIVVGTLALLSVIGVASLAGTLFYKNYADPAVLTAFISITSGSIGALGSLLVNTRQPSGDGSTVSTTTTVQKTPADTQTPTDPMPVQMMNEPKDPVPVEQPQPEPNKP